MQTTLSSREFNQDTGTAKRAARSGPGLITDRGKPSHVLLTVEDYHRLSSKGMTLADAIADPRPEADFEFDPERLQGFSIKPAEFE
jgi:prevent-host-death family protein